MHIILQILDYFFVGLHTFIVLFNLFGWIWARFRRWNLALLILTGLSWFGLGIFYGWGYCPLTDWHFRVLQGLGRTPQETSYISYLLNRLLQLKVDDTLVDSATLICFMVALVTSVILNIRGLRLKDKG
ncbi:MAG: DUF2784 domain-containing protein [Bacteroidales bacterium]|nr:DUF2784 domain-containing protein [Bacteroidales bacterium]